MKRYQYKVACTKAQASALNPVLGSILGSDPEFTQDANIVEWHYETDTPLHVNELISIRGWGCYEIQAIYRWVDIVKEHGASDPLPQL